MNVNMGIILLLVLTAMTVYSQTIFETDNLIETKKRVQLTPQPIPVNELERYKISLTAKTDSLQTIEENSRLMNSNLRHSSSKLYIYFYDKNQKKIGYVYIYIISKKYRDYIREFYTPIRTKSMMIYLCGNKGRDTVILKQCTLTKEENNPIINTHSSFDYSALNSYGYDGIVDYYTRPGDNKTVCNIIGGRTAIFPLKENTFYNFDCKGEFYLNRLHFLKVYDKNGKQLISMKWALKVTPNGERVTLKMPERARYGEIIFYNCIIEELKITEK